MAEPIKEVTIIGGALLLVLLFIVWLIGGGQSDE